MKQSKIDTDRIKLTHISALQHNKASKLTLMAMRKKINIRVQIVFVEAIDGKRRIFLQSPSEATHAIVDYNLALFNKPFLKRLARKLRFKCQKFQNKIFF
jgi:hypothetical protein